jgi:integrase
VGLDTEFGVLCIFLLYTGLRLSEGLRAEIDRLRLEESYLYMPRTKNGQARAVFLPAPAVEALRSHPRGLDRPGARIFKFHKGGHLYTSLRAKSSPRLSHLAFDVDHSGQRGHGGDRRRKLPRTWRPSSPSCARPAQRRCGLLQQD